MEASVGSSARPRAIERLLFAAALVGFAVAALDLSFGGFLFFIGPIRISSRAPLRPFAIGVMSLAAALWTVDRTTTTPSWTRIRSWSSPVAICASLITVLAGIWFSSRAAGGADSYGYVSEAFLWARGNLVINEPLTSIDPVVAEAAVPLGYRLAPDGAMVPVYSPGLPLAMAAAFKIGGTTAMYMVVPLLGGLAVWCTFLIGRRLSGERTGLMAAILLATSPIFLFQLFAPMSDVPVSAWWLAAVALATSAAPWRAFLSGFAASLAVLTRPNLVPLAGVVGLIAAAGQVRPKTFLAFAAGIVPGCVAVAIINRVLYGSSIVSGYGSLETLFKWSHIPTNLHRYPAWLVEVQSPLIFLAVAAPLTLLSNGSRNDEGLRSRETTILLLIYCVAVFLCYIAYLPMDGWPFVRFLLPAIPVMLVLVGTTIVSIIGLTPVSARGALFVACCGLIAGSYVSRAGELGAFTMRENERRFVAVGSYLGHELPERAAVLSVMHSGSLRLYGQRATLQWGRIPPTELDRVVTLLQADGFAPFVLVDGPEEEQFRRRFGAASPIARLDWPPAFEYFSFPGVRIYSLADRDEFLRGRTVLTRPIP